MQKRPQNTNEVFRTLDDAARYAGLSRPTFTRDVLPHIPHRTAGRRVLITRTALQRWLEGHDDREAA
jgi:excisionase family DNA binding protein